MVARWFIVTVATGLIGLGFWQVLYTHSIHPDSFLARLEAGWWGAALVLVGVMTLFALAYYVLREP